MTHFNFEARNFTIRYNIVYFTCAQKPTGLPLSLAHGTKTKNKEKQKPSSSKEMVRVIVHEGSPGEEVKLRGVEGFVKEVGFKPTVKERELWMSRVGKQKRKKMLDVLDEGLCELEIEELDPE